MSQTSNSTSASSTTFESLDAVRGLGALVVVYGHTAGSWGVSSLVVSPIAVDLFFILSGFVIAYVYEPRMAHGLSASDFFRQRIVRLYPLYLIGLCMGAVVWALIMFGDDRRVDWLLAFIPGLLMLPSVPVTGFQELFYFMNGPAWTLFFEIWVNIVYFFIFRWLTIPRLTAIVCVSAIVLSIMAYGYDDNNMGPYWNDAPGGFARVTFCFFVGVLIYRLTGRPSHPPKRRSWVVLMPVIAIIALCFVPRSLNFPLWGELVCVIVVAPLLLVWARSRQLPRAVAAPLLKLGALSYGIYIIHFPLVEFVARLDIRMDGALSALVPATGIGIMVVVIALAFLIDRWLDAPMRRRLDSCLRDMQRTFTQRRVSSSTAPSSLRR